MQTRLIIICSLVLFCVASLVSCQSGQVISLTDAEKIAILDVHNQLRAAVNAQYMPNLVYLSGLELWRNWSQNCIFEHLPQSERSNKAGFSYIGENLALSSINAEIRTFSGIWGQEKKDYVYGPISTSNFAQTAHYTQEVWNKTLAVGCVRINCTGVVNATSPGVILACNYGPGGNYLGQYPYTLCPNGTTCTLQSGSPGANTLTGNAAVSPSSAASRSSAASQSSTSTRSISSTNSATSAVSASTAASISGSTTRSVTSSRAPSATGSTTRSLSTTTSFSPSPAPSSSCIPRTCSPNSCGSIANGCNGGAINCGNCANGTVCGSDNTCSVCAPVNTCSNKQCGTVYDSQCQLLQNCGSCASGQSCYNNQCVNNPNSVCPFTCQQLNYTCGIVVPAACTVTLSCGVCPSGSICRIGQCQSTSCTTTCPANAFCVNGTCRCNLGYNDKQDGNGCTPALTIPYGFTEVFNDNTFGVPQNWVLTADAVTGQPQIDILTVSAGPTFRLSWNAADQYSSLIKTTFSVDARFNNARRLGLGLRFGQGRGRETDAIQWSLGLNEANNAVNTTWEVVWRNQLYSLANNMYDPAATFPWSNGRSGWHTIQLVMTTTKIGGVNYQVSQLFVDGAYLNPETVRPYDVLGGAYLYSLGNTPSFKNLAIYTSTSVYVSVQNCIAPGSLAAMISTATNSSIANITVTSFNDTTGRCAAQVANFSSTTQQRFARQASIPGAVGIGGVSTQFIVELSSQQVSSTALVSQFMDLGLSWSPVFAETGGILSIEPIEAPETVPVNTPLDLNVYFAEPVVNEPIPVAAPTETLSTGAIAGITVGSVVGALLIMSGMIGLAVVAFLVIRARRNASGVESTEIEVVDVESGESSKQVVTAVVKEDETPVVSTDEIVRRAPRGGVNVFDLDPTKRHSITSRLEGRVDSSIGK